MVKRKRKKVPGSYKAPERAPDCEKCRDDLERARRPSLDPLTIRTAKIILDRAARPSFGKKVRVRFGSLDVWACPIHDSFREDETGPVPIGADLRTRRERRLAFRAKVRGPRRKESSDA